MIFLLFLLVYDNYIGELADRLRSLFFLALAAFSVLVLFLKLLDGLVSASPADVRKMGGIPNVLSYNSYTCV